MESITATRSHSRQRPRYIDNIGPSSYPGPVPLPPKRFLTCFCSRIRCTASRTLTTWPSGHRSRLSMLTTSTCLCALVRQPSLTRSSRALELRTSCQRVCTALDTPNRCGSYMRRHSLSPSHPLPVQESGSSCTGEAGSIYETHRRACHALFVRTREQLYINHPTLRVLGIQ